MLKPAVLGVTAWKRESSRRSDQGSCRGQDDLGLQAQFPEAEAAADQVAPGQKAQAAQDDQEHDGDVDRRVGGEGCQGGKLLLRSHQVEAGVAEGGYGVEDGIAQALPESELSGKDGQQAEGADSFYTEGAGDEKAHEADDAADLRGRDRVLDRQARQESDLGAGHGQQGCRGCDDTESADLDQDQDDGPAEQGPLGRRVKDHQSRHAGGGGRGEQGVQEGYFLRPRGSAGQAQ